MPEIPSYQSRLAGPGSSGLDPADPRIVGGEAIQQGFSNLASGLLARAAEARRQEQMDQVIEGENLTNLVTEAVDNKAQELIERQSTNPINPHDLNREFQQYAEELITGTLKDVDSQQFPVLAKHLQGHLPQAVRSRRLAFANDTNARWKDWNRHQITGIAEDKKANAIKNPDKELVEHDNLRRIIGAGIWAGSLTGEYADELEAKWISGVNYGKALLFATQHAAEWVEAGRHGSYPAGFDPTLFTGPELDKISERATHTYNAIATENKEAHTREREQLEEFYTIMENDWYSRHFEHIDNKGQKVAPEPLDKLMNQLASKEVQMMLGPKYHSVATYYNNLDHQRREGVKPTPEKYAEFLINIDKGRYPTPQALTAAASAAPYNFDLTSINNARAAFETSRQLIDTETQQRITQAVKIIEGKFDFSTSQSLDPALGSFNRTEALTQYYLWLEAIKADNREKNKGPRGMREVDFITQAQRVADRQYQTMATGIIRILPTTRASLPYPTADAAAADYKAKKISEHQYKSALQAIENYEALEQIVANAKLLESSKPKTPLR